MRKVEALKKELPEPEVWQVVSGKWSVVSDAEIAKLDIDTLLIGWGSTKGAIFDAITDSNLKTQNSKLAYLHYTYLWPLKTERFMKLVSKAKKTILIEGNYQGQLGMLLRQETGIPIHHKILKYDGRPFFVDELQKEIQQHIELKKPVTKNQ